MSETSVDQRWCAAHGMTRVKRVATLAPFPHAGEMTTGTVEWWECPPCIAAAQGLGGFSAHRLYWRCDIPNSSSAEPFPTEFKCETCKVTVGSVTEIDRLRAENAALTLRIDELAKQLPPPDTKYVIVSDLIVPQLREFGEPLQVMIQEREDNRVEIIFRRAGALVEQQRDAWKVYAKHLEWCGCQTSDDCFEGKRLRALAEA